MERFSELGFENLTTDQKADIPNNPRLKPHMYRYQGMGWYDILIEHIETGKYQVVSFGGENSYVQEANDKKYKELDIEYKTLNELYDSLKDTCWCEIVQEQPYAYGKMQSVVRHGK